MGHMLDGLLVLSRIVRAPLHLQPVSLAELLTQVQTELVGRMGGQRVVHWQLDVQAPLVQADTALLRQLLWQLLDNALKFTQPRTQAEIAVACWPQRTVKCCCASETTESALIQHGLLACSACFNACTAKVNLRV